MPQNPKRENGKTDGTHQQFRGLKSQHEFWQKHQFSYYETIGYDVKAFFAFLHTGYLTIYLSFWFVSWPIWHTATSERRWYWTKFDVFSPCQSLWLWRQMIGHIQQFGFFWWLSSKPTNGHKDIETHFHWVFLPALNARSFHRRWSWFAQAKHRCPWFGWWSGHQFCPMAALVARAWVTFMIDY